MHQRTASDHIGGRWHLFKGHMILYRPGGAFESLKAHSSPCVHACCLPACLRYLNLAQARPTMSCIALVIGASLSEPHLGPYSGCGLCHIMMVVVVVYNVISYVLAPVYKRLYFIRDVTYISPAHALRANVKPAH